MNLADHTRRQFAYNAWANKEVLSTVRIMKSEQERSLQLMSHIVAAERLWLERLKQEPQSLPVWPKPDLAWCGAQASEISNLWQGYLELITAGDLAQTILYKNTKGQTWTNTVIDVLTHVLLHSAYHRGQIASHMREKGYTPAYTDFIHAVRQELVR